MNGSPTPHEIQHASALVTESGGAHVDDLDNVGGPLSPSSVYRASKMPLGLLEAIDRHGTVVARHLVTDWPVMVGRALRADMVLNDSHVAAQHLRLTPAAAGHVTVAVLDTRNGVTLGRKHHVGGDSFDWALEQPLTLGRLHFHLRLADTPLAEEHPLPRQLWRNTLASVGCVLLVMLLMLAQVWLKIGETQNMLQELPVVLVGALAVLMVWSGAWALATRLFSGQAHFWQHVRIASLAFVVGDLLEFLTQVAAFMFSWENVGRFGYLALVLAAAFGIYRHLLVAAPHARRGLAIGVALVVLLGVPTMWGTQWLKNKRISNQLYMAQMFPPNWRLAKPEPTTQFLDQAAGIQKRLDKRLKDKKDENSGEPSESDEE